MVAEARKIVPSRPHVEDLVLVVDPDRVSSVLTARILEKMKYAVECVTDATSALELLQQRQIDLVICEATLPDIPAPTFITTCQRIYAPAALPVLVMTLDLRASARVDLLRAGATECLTKPVEAEELRLRVERALRTRVGALSPAGAVYLSGDLEHVRLTDVLTVADLAKATGHLEVATNREAGRLELVAGRLRHAELGKTTGIEALTSILRLARGWFRLRAGAPTTRPTLEGSMTQLLLEATVDEANRRRSPSARQRSLEELGVSTARITGPAPDLVRRAARILPLLQDPHRLGELELGSRTQEVANDDALTITLFGEDTEVVSALWEISAPLGPHILGGLRQPTACLRWTFHGRDRDRLVVRVVSLDEPSPSWFHLQSDVVIVAAPQTSATMVDPAVRAYVLSHRTPALIVAHQQEGERLFAPAPFSQLQITGQRLSELRGGTRALLVAALKLRGQA